MKQFFKRLKKLLIKIPYCLGESTTPRPFPSRGGYESHLDFLEMHGCISVEERQQQRDLEMELRDHPERFKIMTFEEAFNAAKGSLK